MPMKFRREMRPSPHSITRTTFEAPGNPPLAPSMSCALPMYGRRFAPVGHTSPPLTGSGHLQQRQRSNPGEARVPASPLQYPGGIRATPASFQQLRYGLAGTLAPPAFWIPSEISRSLAFSRCIHSEAFWRESKKVPFCNSWIMHSYTTGSGVGSSKLSFDRFRSRRSVLHRCFPSTNSRSYPESYCPCFVRHGDFCRSRLKTT